MKTTIFALTVLISITIPIAKLIFQVFGINGMYGEFWKQFSPSAYIASAQLLQIGLSFLIALLLVTKLNIRRRIPSPVAGKNLIWLGGLFLFLPGILRIFTSMIPGGGASFALMTYALPVLIVAKILFFIGGAILLLEMKPSAKYSYPE